MTVWKAQLLEKAAGIFGGDALAADGRDRIRELHEKIGELTVERDFSYGLSVVNCPAPNPHARSTIRIF
jgi:transposase